VTNLLGVIHNYMEDQMMTAVLIVLISILLLFVHPVALTVWLMLLAASFTVLGVGHILKAVYRKVAKAARNK
jgi:hypothetical protein